MTSELNWAGNYRYRAERIVSPASLDEAREIVTASRLVRPLGSRHSFNDLVDTDGVLLSLAAMPQRLEIDAVARTVTVAGGMRYGDVASQLNEAGWALPSMASLPHISIAGAISTATHGSGDRIGNLATAVSGLEILTANGELRSLGRGDAEFAGAVVGLGALGLVVAVTLDIQPSFDVSQRIFENLPWGVALEHFDEVTSSAYSVSLFTNWSQESISQVWLKARVDEASSIGDTLFGATAATGPLHMIRGISPENATEQLGVGGPWHERLPHFKLAFTPSNGEEIQSEYILPRRFATAAIETLRGLAGRIAPILQISEIRTVAADDLWLSTAYGEDAVCFHFTWVRDQAAVEAVLPAIEDALAPFGARPHWGKVFVDSAGIVQSLYPRMDDFRDLVRRYDPDRVFGNAFLER
ncbi:MAG: alditol oxidase, partial [Microbacteriaceae bacterium]|nr:alditol oxidase [Microbacteriaceae bacterium]